MNQKTSKWFNRHLSLFLIDFDLKGIQPNQICIRQTFESAIEAKYDHIFGGVEPIFAFTLFNTLAGDSTGSIREEWIDSIAEWAHEHFTDNEYVSVPLLLSIEDIKKYLVALDRMWNA